MLWFLRKVFGVIALAYLALCLLSLVTCYVAPKASGMAFLNIVSWSFIGVPASIIWTVLKIISVLSTPRVEHPYRK